MKKLFYLLVISIPLITACKDDDPVDANGLIGEWEWVSSYGGIGGQTLTPASEGVTRHLEIDADTYKEFENDSLILQTQYEIETRQDTFSGTNVYMIFGTGYEVAVLRDGDDLQLFELCFDCFNHTYVRK